MHNLSTAWNWHPSLTTSLRTSKAPQDVWRSRQCPECFVIAQYPKSSDWYEPIAHALRRAGSYSPFFNLASASSNDVADRFPTLGQLNIWSKVMPSRSVRRLIPRDCSVWCTEGLTSPTILSASMLAGFWRSISAPRSNSSTRRQTLRTDSGVRPNSLPIR